MSTKLKLCLVLLVLVVAVAAFGAAAEAARGFLVLQGPSPRAETQLLVSTGLAEQIIDVPPDPPGGTLPATGVSLINWFWAGALLLAAGGLVRRLMVR